jgi:hypothetical protein
MRVTKPYKLIGFGAMRVTKPYKLHRAWGHAVILVAWTPLMLPLRRIGLKGLGGRLASAEAMGARTETWGICNRDARRGPGATLGTDFGRLGGDRDSNRDLGRGPG